MIERPKYKFGLQYEYDNLTIKDQRTIYLITDTKRIYIGNKLYIGNSNINPQNIHIDLSNYVTQQQLTQTINNIDLSDYVTLDNLQQAINNISLPQPDLTGLLPKITPISNNNNNKIAIIADGGASLASSNVNINDLNNTIAAANSIILLTQNDYNNLSQKIVNKIYITTDTNKIYIGDTEYTSGTTSVGNFIPIIQAEPVDANENKIPLITDTGTLKPSNFTLQALMNYFVNNLNLLTKDDITVTTKAEYDALSVVNPDTIYILSDTKQIYIGTDIYSSGTAQQISSAPGVANGDGEVNDLPVNSTIQSPIYVTV